MLFGLFIVSLLVFEGWRRRGLYWYDIGADYEYRFMSEDLQRIPVQVEGPAFTFPAWALDWASAFVAVSVQPRITSRWLEPSIEVLVDGRPICRQYFERGARGRRYVNLCLRAEDTRPGAEVAMRGHHISVRGPEAEVLLFAAPDLDTARILVLAPHADDAEIAAFGAYAGRESWVVTVTTGSYPGQKYRDLAPDSVDREELQARLRVWDSLIVPRWGGVRVEQTLNLGYFTGTLESMYSTPSREVRNPLSGSTDVGRWRELNPDSLLPEETAQSTWLSLVADLTRIVGRVRPAIIVAPHPALDANRDHVYTTAALLEALARLEDPALELLLYTNHHVLSEYFPYGPADGTIPLPPWSDSAVTFRAVYSHPLNSDMQRDKLFALDQMHDLRPAPEPVVGGPAEVFLHQTWRAIAELWRDPVREYSYFRRAVRPNELFFVYRSSDRETLQRFVQARDPSSASMSADSTGVLREIGQ